MGTTHVSGLILSLKDGISSVVIEHKLFQRSVKSRVVSAVIIRLSFRLSISVNENHVILYYRNILSLLYHNHHQVNSISTNNIGKIR